jgi:hypothetical protein
MNGLSNELKVLLSVKISRDIESMKLIIDSMGVGIEKSKVWKRWSSHNLYLRGLHHFMMQTSKFSTRKITCERDYYT